METGIRVFFKCGYFKDFDPVEADGYHFDGGRLRLDGYVQSYPEDEIERIVLYEITNEKIDGMYVRIFKDETAIFCKSDKTEGE